MYEPVHVRSKKLLSWQCPDHLLMLQVHVLYIVRLRETETVGIRKSGHCQDILFQLESQQGYMYLGSTHHNVLGVFIRLKLPVSWVFHEVQGLGNVPCFLFFLVQSNYIDFALSQLLVIVISTILRTPGVINCLIVHVHVHL